MPISSSAADLLFRGRADMSDAKKEFRELRSEATGSFKAMASESESANAALGSFLGNLAAGVVQEFSQQLIVGAKAVLDYSSRMEQTKIGFTTLMGGAQQAEKHLKELHKFAQATPFEFEDLTVASRRLQNVGLEAEKVIPVMRDIGNAAAAAGASSQELDSITLAFSQIIAKGKLSAEEVNQLAERGIPVWRMLSDQLGKSKEEIIKLAEQGRISSDVFLTAFQRFSQANFGDAMEKQSRTFSGAMSTIKDITMTTAATAFKPLYDEISKFAVNVAESLSKQQAQTNAAGVSFGQSLGTAIGVGIRMSGVGAEGYWNSWFFGPSAIYKIGEAAYDFGVSIGRGAREGFNQGFNDKGIDPSGQGFTLNPATGTVTWGGQAAGANQPGGPSLGLPPGKVHTIDVPRADSQGDFDRRRKEYLEKQAADAVRITENEMRQTLEFYRAGYARRAIELEQRMANEKRSLVEHTREMGRIRKEGLMDEIRLNEELLKNANLTAEKRKEIEHRLRVLRVELQVQEIKNAVDVKEAIDRETDARDRNSESLRRENEELERKINLGLEELAQEIRKDELRKQREAEASQVANSGLGGGIADALGVDLVSIFDPEKINVIKQHAQFIKDVYLDIQRTAGQAIGSMVQGLAQLVTAWITTGKFSAKAALQMAAGVAIGLAMQAAMKAIFEQAEAIAAAARWDFASAALHAAAAAMYWKVAIVAGAIGVGLGLASRAFGNGNSPNAASSAFAGQTSGNQRSRNVDGQGRPYSSFGDDVTVIDNGVNSPFRISPVKVDLNIKLDSDGVLDVVEADANRHGRMKTLIERYS